MPDARYPMPDTRVSSTGGCNGPGFDAGCKTRSNQPVEVPGCQVVACRCRSVKRSPLD